LGGQAGAGDLAVDAAREVGGAAVFAGHGSHFIASRDVFGAHLRTGQLALEPGQLVVPLRPRIAAGRIRLGQFGLYFGAALAGDERRGVDRDVVGEGVARGERGGKGKGEFAVMRVSSL
jgi:hypothetical protein